MESMGPLLTLLFALAWLTVLIVFTVKGMLKWAVAFVLWGLALLPLAQGLILAYAVPPDRPLIGAANPAIPLIMACVMVAMGVVALLLKKSYTQPPKISARGVRWVVLIVVVLFHFSALIAALMAIYSPQVFGSREPVPQTGLWAYIIMVTACAVGYYVISRMNSEHRPNLFRWVVFWVSTNFWTWTTILGLIMFYSVPGEPTPVYASLSAITQLAYIPFGLLQLGLARDHYQD